MELWKEAKLPILIFCANFARSLISLYTCILPLKIKENVVFGYAKPRTEKIKRRYSVELNTQLLRFQRV